MGMLRVFNFGVTRGLDPLVHRPR